MHYTIHLNRRDSFEFLKLIKKSPSESQFVIKFAYLFDLVVIKLQDTLSSTWKLCSEFKRYSSHAIINSISCSHKSSLSFFRHFKHTHRV